MKRLLITVFALLTLAGVLAPAAPAFAWSPFSDACSKGGSGGSAVCSAGSGNNISGSNGILNKTARIIAFISGAAAVIMLITAGFMYITSDGDGSKIQSAKNMIIYTVVGLVIVVMAESIVVFVLNKFL